MTPPRFKNIHIRPFRALYDLKLESLGRLNLFVGPNSTGKTSVLEAVSVCCHPDDPRKWIAMINRRGHGAPRERIKDMFPWLFPYFSQGGRGSEIDIEYERAGIPPRWHLNAHIDRVAAIRTDAESEEGTEDTLRARLIIEPVGAPPDSSHRTPPVEFVVREGAALPPARSAESVPMVAVAPTTHRSEIFQITALSRLDDRATHNAVVTLLKDFDPGVEDIEVYDREGTRSALRVWHRDTGMTPINVFGDGFRRVLTYALSLVQCKDGVLLIDEIETAIHYAALQRVYRWLEEASEALNVQIFATTHSLEAIDAMIAAAPEGRGPRLYKLRRTSSGVKVAAYSADELRTLRVEFGDEVRQ